MNDILEKIGVTHGELSSSEFSLMECFLMSTSC